MDTMQLWKRLEFDGQPVYVHPEKPDWIVPDQLADSLWQALDVHRQLGEAICGQAGSGNLHKDLLDITRLVSQTAPSPSPPYAGRASVLKLNKLKECWFHITNNCNLACRHCLFGASPVESQALDPALLKQGLNEARQAGCSLFYFTGGEPFVYPGFVGILAELLTDPAIHAVVLTNGLLLEQFRDELQRLPQDRLHLQISMDGLEDAHEQLRGAGTFARLLDNLALLQSINIRPTLSVAVSRANLAQLPEMVAFAAAQGFKNIHLLWHFVRGKGTREQFVSPAEILPQLIKSQEIAEAAGMAIDNVETIRSQVFSTPGTRFDLSNTGWESIAVGPDGCIYPSPALVGLDELNCGPLSEGLDLVWRTSPVLEKIRQASLIENEGLHNDPLKFLVGGGDIDHSYLTGGEFVGHDPYLELYKNLALWLIVRQARQYENRASGSILLRMGDVRYDCPDGSRAVALTHCNCVISWSEDQGHTSVREFYGRAAVLANEDIVNPFAPEHAEAEFIPLASRKRSYGCGSPVNDAALKTGEVLVDLGSGSGVECFIAAEKVGRAGKVYGIDMTDEMLELARSSQEKVAAELGYANVEFRQGFLEDLPLSDGMADVVISNCVINLSPDKRKTFHEIYRVLKPGGRMVVSDIVTDAPIPVEIKNNEKFRGECLGGAMQQEDLMAMLKGVGFGSARLVKRFPYRQEGDTTFYSLTFSCYKPAAAQEVEVIYRGPFGAVYTEGGTLLLKGKRTTVSLTEVGSLGDSVFIMDKQGAVTNVPMTNSCCGPSTRPEIMPLTKIVTMPGVSGCCDQEPAMLPEKVEKIVSISHQPTASLTSRHHSGCMVCGGELVYLQQERDISCYYCGGVKKTNALCRNEHFVCDDCHQQDGLSVIKLICLETTETDMLALFRKIRRHPVLPMHGPEHHALVPGIILATYRNLGGPISRDAVLTGIERGSKVPGGVCGFWGNCGAATGVGIAFSVMLGANPLTPDARQKAQQASARVLAEVSRIKGSRCCQRESVTALKEAVVLSGEFLPVSLQASEDFCCTQFAANKDCIRTRCPLWCDKENMGTAAENVRTKQRY